MKSTILAAVILTTLTGPVAVLAEAPALTVKPLAADMAPIDVESNAQQAVAETLSEAETAASELTEPQAVTETLSEDAVIIAAPVEPQVDSQMPAEATAPATAMVEQQAAMETPLEAVAAGAVASVTGNPGQPCPMQGTGMMRKGMGQGGKGPACRKPGCDRHGGGQQNKHEQVVRRLDMIDARIAKIEAMLESLMQR